MSSLAAAFVLEDKCFTDPAQGNRKTWGLSLSVYPGACLCHHWTGPFRSERCICMHTEVGQEHERPFFLYSEQCGVQGQTRVFADMKGCFVSAWVNTDCHGLVCADAGAGVGKSQNSDSGVV